ncbi:hypothetical protein PROFUN_04685 [Planoprotostelium fungivorum]|uniref:Uncharacterized protein n=1 Tax=Planoprotostelium fungivorum TaxID=1890364 RepID=A0A2P6NFX1_9EUKA|nr:hypothetical protein PROFUN_04685 [Planoprotostelium fungivorum]
METRLSSTQKPSASTPLDRKVNDEENPPPPFSSMGRTSMRSSTLALCRARCESNGCGPLESRENTTRTFSAPKRLMVSALCENTQEGGWEKGNEDFNAFDFSDPSLNLNVQTSLFDSNKEDTSQTIEKLIDASISLSEGAPTIFNEELISLMNCTICGVNSAEESIEIGGALFNSCLSCYEQNSTAETVSEPIIETSLVPNSSQAPARQNRKRAASTPRQKPQSNATRKRREQQHADDRQVEEHETDAFSPRYITQCMAAMI